MNTVYAATSVMKMATEAHYEEGAVGESICTMCEEIDIRADSFPSLLVKIANRYGLDQSTVTDGELSEDGDRWDFNTFEDENCNDSTPRQREQFARDEIVLYLCDWSFSVEKRTTQPIQPEETATETPIAS